MSTSLKDKIYQFAYDVGFDLVGITYPKIDNPSHFLDWIGKGYAGDMRYLERNVDKRLDPKLLFPEVKSIICLGLNYYQRPPVISTKEMGRVSIYAYGEDYHIVVRKKLHLLAEKIHRAVGDNFRFRAFVDTAPVLEQQLAQQAGLGWIGKNGCLINREIGSFFFLGELFINVDIPPDEPAKNYCGNCNRCISACPTSAILGNTFINSTRCISYLTIEYKGDIPDGLRRSIGNWIYGCDICQLVCPFNRKVVPTNVKEFNRHILGPYIDAEDVLSWNEDTYYAKLKNSSANRASLAQWKRNAKIVIENSS